MSRIGLFRRTVRHLTARQLIHQVLNRLRSPARLRLPDVAPISHHLTVSEANKPASWSSGTFTLLNRSVNMEIIDWNYADHGKLWTYNLNYFDFLNQQSDGLGGAIESQTGLTLIRDFIAQTNSLNDGLEPYPTSLRITNWMQFLSRNQIQDDAIKRHLYAQARLLRWRLEYHLAGNHLLENGFALLTAALYFRHNAWFRRGAKLVRTELLTQILADGGHDERSPMYHQILLDRLLDVLLALKHDTWHNDPTLISFLAEKATRMLGWLNVITFRNGDVPMMNDAAFYIAPSTAQLRAKAVRVGLSGLWSVSSQTTEATTSTYEIGTRRAWERSTAAHNTVDVTGVNSSEVWAGFRVGRRARTTVLADREATLTARHDGYRHLGLVHERTWLVDSGHIQITDHLTGTETAATKNYVGVARLHFHPDVPVSLAENSINAGAVRITFASVPTPELRLIAYDMADGFNRLRPATCVEITFTNYLKTLLIPAR